MEEQTHLSAGPQAVVRLPEFNFAWLILWPARMEATVSLETSVDSQQTKRRYIPEDKSS
jgi:hypothetical protein